METQAAALDSLDGLDQLFRNHGWLDGALGWVTMCPDGPGDGRDRGGDVRLRAVMRGYVQGVGFRYFVLERVRGTGLRGWVRNRGDGSVECVAEGPRARLERLVEELRKGPRWAEVSDVEIDWQPARGDLPEFRVTG